MNREECFERWAPLDALWSPWAKPVLFAQLLDVPGDEPIPEQSLPDVSWLPDASGDTALVLDLPGPEAVDAGIALARAGYRPVPLYNANVDSAAVVPVQPIMERLRVGALMLPEAGRLRNDAPPAFLLDANRMRPALTLTPGRFDNRWLVLPQDFPSATALRTHGVKRVTVVQQDQTDPQADLRHVLLRWQNAGILLSVVDYDARSTPQPLLVHPPSLFQVAWYRVVALMGLRRSNAGGFGGLIPEPSASMGLG